MTTPNPNHKLFDEFVKKYGTILEPIIRELKKSKKFTKKKLMTCFLSLRLRNKLLM